MREIPNYWKTSLKDVEEAVGRVQKGTVETAGYSAGGRPIYLVRYGEKNALKRTANMSCALGAGDPSCYADKSAADYRPTILLVGCIHGGEFEGVAALLNLLHILETGEDLAGSSGAALQELSREATLLILPCVNPDGRSRIPFDSMVGKSFEQLRYYNQGTWKDGSLCGYPDCKKIHPIKDYAGFLGAYFNDDGINLMHDDFFGKKAPETQILFNITDSYVPDITVLLHGGANTKGCILKPAYAPELLKQRAMELEERVAARCAAEQIPYRVTPMDRGEQKQPPSSFNLTSALSHFSGELCVTYESNQGLAYEGAQDYPEIYRTHMLLFEEILKQFGQKEREEV
ncbi:MAG: hypothetical protein HFI90_01295 [Clostridia bacterium]|nr:hypothetical protein [Clostridia bacterium]